MPRNNSLKAFIKGIARTGNFSQKQLRDASIQLNIAAHGGPCCVNTDYPFVNSAFGNSCARFSSNTPLKPDNDPTFQHYIKFVDQEGQDDFYVNVPFEEVAGFEGTGTYQVPASGVLVLPVGLTGTYVAIIAIMLSPDYPGVLFLDADGNTIVGGSSGNGPISTAVFDIEDVASFQFVAQCSG